MYNGQGKVQKHFVLTVVQPCALGHLIPPIQIAVYKKKLILVRQTLRSIIRVLP